MNAHHERGRLLFHRERFDEAIAELQQAIADDPKDPYSHGLLGLCLSRLDRYQPALAAAKKAIEIAPDCDYAYYVLAQVHVGRNHLSEAREAVQSAIRLDPDCAQNHGLHARIEFEAGNWTETANAADAGLAVDATDDVCLHYRSLALVKLGRADEAAHVQETLLAADPNDPYSHVARGWTLLEQGGAEKAREHFFEALRLDPTNESARIGLANALKAKHLLFGLALRVLLYLDRFRAWVFWIFGIGFFVVLRQLDHLALRFPDLFIPLVLLRAFFWTFLILIVIAQPLFDLILRLDPVGRRTLTPEQVNASNWHAVCLIAALAMALLWAQFGGIQMRTLAIATVMLTSTIAATSHATAGWVRTRMKWITVFAAALIPFSYVLLIATAVFLLKLKAIAIPMIELSVFYLPLLSLLISAFAHDIAAFLEKRRPDAVAPLTRV